MRCPPRAQYPSKLVEHDFGKFEVLGVVVNAADEDPTGAVSDGYLYARGCLEATLINYNKSVPDYEGWRRLCSPDGMAVGAAYSDVLTELRNGQMSYASVCERKFHGHCLTSRMTFTMLVGRMRDLKKGR
jgi:hypothetical protein